MFISSKKMCIIFYIINVVKNENRLEGFILLFLCTNNNFHFLENTNNN